MYFILPKHDTVDEFIPKALKDHGTVYVKKSLRPGEDFLQHVQFPRLRDTPGALVRTRTVGACLCEGLQAIHG